MTIIGVSRKEQTIDTMRAVIKEAKGIDYSSPQVRQMRTWDPFVDEMWAEYREKVPV